MKKKIFTQEQKMLHHLILHSHDVPTAWGLFDGMTGIMLVLAHYARVHKMPVIEHVADYLMEQITGNIAKTDSVYLGNGMAGIGWAIEYLIQNGYMKGCGVELTREIDERIMSTDILRITDDTIEKGFIGLFHYVIAHVQGATRQGRPVFDSQYLENWTQALKLRQQRFPQEKQWEKMAVMLTTAVNGQNPYSLDLRQFIRPIKRAPFGLLGLHKGLAGYMELQLHNNGKNNKEI